MPHVCCPVSKGQLNAFGSLAENKEACKLLDVGFEYVRCSGVLLKGQLTALEDAPIIPGNVASYALYSLLCLVLSRETAGNIRRPDKAVSLTYFNT